MWSPITIRQGILSEIDTTAIRTSLDNNIERLYQIAVIDGEARVYHTERTTTATHLWSFVKSLGTAKAVATEVDCHWEFDTDDRAYRPITEDVPWFFVVDKEDRLIAYHGTLEALEPKEVLAENVDKVSAVRGWQSYQMPDEYDMGIIVAYIKDQEVKYRQRKFGAWYPEQTLDLEDEDITGIPLDVKVARSNDFRILFFVTVSETKDDDEPDVYLLGTYRLPQSGMAVGPEYIDISVSASIDIDFIEIYRHAINGPFTTDVGHLQKQKGELESEYTSINVKGEIQPVQIYYAAGTEIRYVENIPDEDGNWGNRIYVAFYHPIIMLDDAHDHFKLVHNDDEYAVINVEPDHDPLNHPPRYYIMDTTNFNDVVEEGESEAELTLEYEPVGAKVAPTKDADYEMSKTFTATNLVSPDVDRAEVEAVWNE